MKHLSENFSFNKIRIFPDDSENEIWYLGEQENVAIGKNIILLIIRHIFETQIHIQTQIRKNFTLP